VPSVDEFDTETEDLALTTDLVELLRGRMAELERRFGMVSKRNGELLDQNKALAARIVELETTLAWVSARGQQQS
jgi:BMFP domain-containing protein YqiC